MAVGIVKLHACMLLIDFQRQFYFNTFMKYMFSDMTSVILANVNTNIDSDLFSRFSDKFVALFYSNYFYWHFVLISLVKQFNNRFIKY